MKSYFSITTLTLIFLFVSFNTHVQPKDIYFADLLKHLNNKDVKNNEGYGWRNGSVSNAKVFNNIRKKLGEKFKPKLLEFISDRIYRHYHSALYITQDYYLQGNEPLPYLAIAILQQGIILIQKQKNEIIKTEEISLRVELAILCQRYGLHALASHHKKNAIKLFNKGGLYSTAFPALGPENRKTYDSITKIE